MAPRSRRSVDPGRCRVHRLSHEAHRESLTPIAPETVAKLGPCPHCAIAVRAWVLCRSDLPHGRVSWPRPGQPGPEQTWEIRSGDTSTWYISRRWARMSRTIIPRAQSAMTRSLNPSSRVWPLRTICGSNVPLRSLGTARSTAPISGSTVLPLARTHRQRSSTAGHRNYRVRARVMVPTPRGCSPRAGASRQMPPRFRDDHQHPRYLE